jgi:hypothetical protein
VDLIGPVLLGFATAVVYNQGENGKGLMLFFGIVCTLIPIGYLFKNASSIDEPSNNDREDVAIEYFNKKYESMGYNKFWTNSELKTEFPNIDKKNPIISKKNTLSESENSPVFIQNKSTGERRYISQNEWEQMKKEGDDVSYKILG